MTLSERLADGGTAILADLRDVLDEEQFAVVAGRLATLSDLGVRAALGEQGATEKMQIVLAGLNQIRAGAGVQIAKRWAERFEAELRRAFLAAAAAASV